MADMFSQMHAFGRSENVPVVVAYLTYWQKESQAQKVERLVVDSGLRYVNLSLLFRHDDFRKYRIYPIDTHPNARANAKFANGLYDYLSKEKLLGRKSTD